MRVQVGARIREQRKAKNLSQSDLEKRSGMPRCRISWLEHGRAVPTLDTLQRIADALEIPVHRLLSEDQERAHDKKVPVDLGKQGSSSQEKKGARVFGELRKHLSRMCDEDKVLLVFIAEKMAGRS